MFISKFPEAIEFISDGPIGSVLDVVGPLSSLPPFLEAVIGDAEVSSGGDFIEHGIVVIGGQWSGL